MKFKLDENLGRAQVAQLQGSGHDVSTVAQQKMGQAEDRDLAETCRKEGRCLVTLDLDFSSPIHFPPEDTAGIVVLRATGHINQAKLNLLCQTLIEGLKQQDPKGKTWIVEAGRIRIHREKPEGGS